jgi:hypothetical protein
MNRSLRITVAVCIGCLVTGAELLAQDKLTQVRLDFSTDPGWESMNNRIEASNPPTIKQDFGWTNTNHTGAGPGEIGGTIWRSRTMAYYALPLGKPLSFKDAFSASGKVTLMPCEKSGGAYIGFFNHERQEWRPWSSMVWRIGDYPRGGEIHMDYMTATWLASGSRLPVILPADGKPHTWSMKYDPNEWIDSNNWPSPVLKKILTPQRQKEDDLFELARKDEPGLTRDQFAKWLEQASERGLVASTRLGDFQAWTSTSNPQDFQGAFSFQFDSGRVFKMFVSKEERNAPVVMDRFGIFNFQLYGRHWEFYDNESTGTSSEFYLGDLTVNGVKIDLRKNPAWEGVGNRVSFVDRDFHGRHNFGFSQTNWAGKQSGEIGGTVWRNEVIDPLHAYYADPVGTLTLDDPISFSGELVFVDGATDGDVQIGFFNADARKAVYSGGNRDYPPDLAQQKGARNKIHLGFDKRGMEIGGVLGFAIGGPTRVGYYFATVCRPTGEAASMQNGPVIHPDKRRRHFSFDYDPKANNGVGRIVGKLDDESFTLDLTPQMRAAGATFTHFGISSIRIGGKWVTVYLDDLNYTARRPDGYQPVRHQQKTVVIPYPPSGRTY